MGAHVPVAGRDPRRTEAAAREIRSAGGGPVDAFVADLSAQAEVHRLADEVHQRLPRLHELINNVGGYWNTRHVTADGFERTFGLNHLAPFLLTDLLLDRLRESSPARVFTVSSTRTPAGRSTSTICRANGATPAPAPTTSQAGERSLHLRAGSATGATSVTANALHPGVVRTSFGAEDPGRAQRLAVPLMRPFMKSPPREQPPRSTSPSLPNWSG